MKVTTFRSQLLGDLTDFLRSEGMSCAETADALVTLAVALSRYQEEGVALYPRIVVCDDLAQALRLLQGTEQIVLGDGERNEQTARAAMKKCAPLARGAWVGFLERAPPGFKFGVFRESASPTAIGLRDTVRGLSDSKVPGIVLLSHLADKAVELLGARGHHLVVHLSAAEGDQPSPLDDVERLAAIIAAGASGSQEALETFLRSLLADILRRGHGALIAVTKDGIPDALADGVPLPVVVDFGAAVHDHQISSSSETRSRLLAYTELLEGVLSTDGIATFSTAGQLLGYNAFVKPTTNADLLPRNQVGGARRRAFEVLCSLVDAKVLVAAFMRSSDGTSKFYRRNP